MNFPILVTVGPNGFAVSDRVPDRVPAPPSFFSEGLREVTANELFHLAPMCAGLPVGDRLPVPLRDGSMVLVSFDEWERYQTAVRTATREVA